jgi:hypothetical protein
MVCNPHRCGQSQGSLFNYGIGERVFRQKARGIFVAINLLGNTSRLKISRDGYYLNGQKN